MANISQNTEKTQDSIPTLTAEDIEKLIKSPSQKKIEITQKIASYYSNGGFDSSEIDIAQEIFSTLVKDAEVEIRKALAEAVKDVETIPHDLVMELAQDVSEVSVPVLEFSEVLTDEDLIEIISTTNDMKKQMGVSKRDKVSQTVSGALVETGNEFVVDSLLNNEGAEISEESYTDIVDQFADKEHIMGSVVTRDALPVTVVERLSEKVSDAVYRSLAEKHTEQFERLSDVLGKSREAATFSMIGMTSSKQDYYQFKSLMERLKIEDDQAPIYALCMGNLNIFEVYLARITSTPLMNIRTLIEDNTKKGLKALYERAHLPDALYGIVSILVDVLNAMNKELEAHGIKLNEDQAQKVIADLTKRAKQHNEMTHLEYIISLIEHNVAVAKKD